MQECKEFQLKDHIFQEDEAFSLKSEPANVFKVLRAETKREARQKQLTSLYPDAGGP